MAETRIGRTVEASPQKKEIGYFFLPPLLSPSHLFLPLPSISEAVPIGPKPQQIFPLVATGMPFFDCATRSQAGFLSLRVCVSLALPDRFLLLALPVFSLYLFTCWLLMQTQHCCGFWLFSARVFNDDEESFYCTSFGFAKNTFFGSAPWDWFWFVIFQGHCRSNVS